MKICTVCQRCYEDSAAHCEENHGSLATERAGTRQMIANYRLDFLLERDAAGSKYLATHIVLNQPFVTRIISRSVIDGAGEMAREAFLGEAQAAANIFHPNLIRVCESGSLESGDLYTVTELVSGRTLSEYLRDTGSLPPADEAVIITRQAAEALEAAHNAGVIHRAINPANIILIRDEQQNLSVKLQNFDFGGLEQQTIADNKSGAVQSQIDAARYFSPEQRAGETVDARTDIYSLAFVLYEMLCGRPPFDSPTSQQINEQPLERLHFDIKALLTHVLKNSLQQRPEARTPKSANFVRLLRHIEQIIARLSGSFTKAAQPSLPKTTALGAASDSDYASLPPEIKQAASEPLPPFLINTPVLSDTKAPAPLDSEIWLPITPVTAQPPKPVEEIKENTADSKDVFSPNSEWIPVREKESLVEQSVFSSEPEWIPVKEAVSDVKPSPIEPVLFMDSESDAAPTVPPFEPEPVFVEKKQFETAPLEPEQNSAERIEVVAAPIHAQTAPHADARNTRRTQITIPDFVNSHGDNRAPRRLSPNRQSLVVGAGLCALIVFAILGALLFNQQSQQIPSGQTITDSSTAPQNSSEANDEASVATDSEIAETEESASSPIEESTSTASKPENSNQARQEKLTDNVAAKQNESDGQQTAGEKPVSTGVERAADDGIQENQPREASAGGAPQRELNASLDKWVNATNARDVDQQMNYYAPKVNSFYRVQNASLEAVRAEKKRVFGRAETVTIQASKPEIALSPDGRSATMRFRKKYMIKERQRSRNGEVVQELQWVKSDDGWRIVSERDMQVIAR